MAKMVEYRARRGSHLNDRDAETLGPVLVEMAQKHDAEVEHLTPQEVVEAARDAKSPLHSYFDWDNRSAADAYRLTQARNMINSIRIVIIEEQTTGPVTYVVPGLVSVRVAGAKVNPVYVPMMNAIEHPDAMRQIIDDAWARLRYWSNRFDEYRRLPDFAEFEPVFEAISAAEAAHKQAEQSEQPKEVTAARE